MSSTRGFAHEIDIDQVVWMGRLGRGAHGETWFARVGESDVCVAKRIPCEDAEAQRRLLRRLARIAGCRDDALVPVVGMASDGDTVTLVRALDPGASLGRLVSVGSLAARHVGALAEGILKGLAALQARELVHGAIHPGNVFIGNDGRISLSDAGLASQAFPRTQRRADLEATTLLLREVWGSTRRAINPALATLIEHDGFSKAGDAAGALHALLAAWPDSDRVTGRAGLGEFARRIAGDGAPVPQELLPSTVSTPRLTSLPIPVMPDQPAPPWSDVIVPSRRARTRVSARSLGAVAVVVAVLALVLGVTLVTHYAPPSPKSGAAHTAQRQSGHGSLQPAASPTADVKPGLAVLEPPALAAFGYIDGAVLAVAPGGCEPGRTCTLMSRIDLGQHPTGTVAWQVVAVNRCSGAETVLATASGVDEETYEYMWQNVPVTLPEGPLALYAVSVSPVRVASPALDIPAGLADCPAPGT